MQLFKTSDTLGISFFNIFELHIGKIEKSSFKICKNKNIGMIFSIRIGKIYMTLWDNK